VRSNIVSTKDRCSGALSQYNIADRGPGLPQQRVSRNSILANSGEKRTNAAAAARFFSPTVVRDLARTGQSGLLARLLHESLIRDKLADDRTLADLFEIAFDQLRHRTSRHEYVYKSVILQKVLLGVHSLRTASLVTEMRAGACKADVVVLNGTSTAYEIKSERDSLDRLPRQLEAYLKVFAQVNVICGHKHVEKLLQLVPEIVGIIALSDRHQMTTIRHSTDNTANTNSLQVFESMRISEAKRAANILGYNTPAVPNTQMHNELASIFSRVDPAELQPVFVRVLRESRSAIQLEQFLKSIPDSLKAAVFSTKLRKSEQERLLTALSTPVRQALSWA